MLYNVVLVSAVQQSKSAVCIHISPPHNIPPLLVITEHRAELPVLYGSCPLAICFTHGSVYMLEKVMAPHSSTLAWKIPWMEKPGGLQSMGLLRVRHD